MTAKEADRKARQRWGSAAVAIRRGGGGPAFVVGYYKNGLPTGPPPWPIVICGGGSSWEEAFAQADEESM